MALTVTSASMKLVVKRTFLEFVEPELGERTIRSRGLTDSGFFTNGDFSESSDSTSIPTSSAPSDICSDVEAPVSDVVDDMASAWLSPSPSPLWEPRADPIMATSEFVVPAFELPPWDSALATPFLEIQGMSPFDEIPNSIYGGYMSHMTTLQTPPGCWLTTVDHTKSGARSTCAKTGGFARNAANVACEVAEDLRTTVMLRPLPPSFTRDLLVELLDTEGFTGMYDFVYLPVDFNSAKSLGYAFVNLTSPEAARCLWSHFNGFCDWRTPFDEVCAASWSEPHQGLAAHVKRYRDSPVMHPEVPEAWKPLIFVNSQRAPFPPPTRKLKAPKLKHKYA